MKEIWELLDENGCYSGIRISREERDEIPDGLYFPCVEIWVRVGDRLLLTRRHPDKREGLKYDVPGGAVLSGESMTDGAIRELFEEVGISASADRLIYLGSVTVGRAYATSYLLYLDTIPRLTLQPSEVVDYSLCTAPELDSMQHELTVGTGIRYRLYKRKLFA